MLQLFLEVDEVSQCQDLRNVFCGGGELTPAIARRFQEVLPEARLHNVYGPTETTVINSVWTLQPGAEVPTSTMHRCRLASVVICISAVSVWPVVTWGCRH